jgi:CheY-like chemotaxis protein
MPTILIVDNEPIISTRLEEVLRCRHPDCRVDGFTSGTEAAEYMTHYRVDVLITDSIREGPVTGEALLHKGTRQNPKMRSILITAAPEKAEDLRRGPQASVAYLIDKTDPETQLEGEVIRRVNDALYLEDAAWAHLADPFSKEVKTATEWRPEYESVRRRLIDAKRRLGTLEAEDRAVLERLQHLHGIWLDALEPLDLSGIREERQELSALKESFVHEQKR